MQRKVATIDGYGEVSWRQEAMPELQDNEVLIKVHASLISPGTEMGKVKQWRRTPQPEIQPTPFGYANAGEVIEIKGQTKEIKPGTRVAAMGAGYAGHADYARVPVNLVAPIPDEVSYAQATYGCLGATALHGVRRTAPLLGEYGLVLGLGIVGNLTAQLCQLSGARVIAWELAEERRKIAAQCGIKKSSDPREFSVNHIPREMPYGADFAVMAFGGQGDSAFQQVMQWMKVSADGHAMGRITLIGGVQVNIEGGAALGNIDLRIAARTGPGYHDSAYEHGANYPAAFVDFTTQRNLREIIQLIAEKKLLVDPISTHFIPLTQVQEAAEILLEQPEQGLGVVLTMDDS